jgi:hypothetical protein
VERVKKPAMIEDLSPNTEPLRVDLFERCLYATLCLVAALWSGFLLLYPAHDPIATKKTSLSLVFQKESASEVTIDDSTAHEKTETVDQTSSNEVPDALREQELDVQAAKERVIISSTDLIQDALNQFETPNIEAERSSQYFDPRLDEALQEARLRKPESVERFNDKKEYFTLFGEHTIRKGNLCTKDHTTLAKLAQVDHMYMTGVCGYKDEFEFEYKPENRGYLYPSFNVDREK